MRFFIFSLDIFSTLEGLCQIPKIVTLSFIRLNAHTEWFSPESAASRASRAKNSRRKEERERRRPASGTARHAPAHPSRGARGRRKQPWRACSITSRRSPRCVDPPRDSAARLEKCRRRRRRRGSSRDASAERRLRNARPRRRVLRRARLGRRASSPPFLPRRRRLTSPVSRTKRCRSKRRSPRRRISSMWCFPGRSARRRRWSIAGTPSRASASSTCAR